MKKADPVTTENENRLAAIVGTLAAREPNGLLIIPASECEMFMLRFERMRVERQNGGDVEVEVKLATLTS